MSAGAYVLAKFDDRNKLLPAIEVLGGLPEVARCDAVDGHYDLVVKLKSGNSPVIEQIRKLAGFAGLATCELQSDNEKEPDPSSDYSYSYLFIETEPDRQKAVQNCLEDMEAISFCSPATGGCHLVAMVQGETFDQIDRTVDVNIRSLDGILRLKQDRIIFLDRM
jgi:nitrate reductase NapAB chaperone NapD